jgi:hypothetical protein
MMFLHQHIDAFAWQAQGWVQKFTDVYHTNNVTPYIHALANHVSEFMKLHGSIISFTQHGLEKYEYERTIKMHYVKLLRNKIAYTIWEIT